MMIDLRYLGRVKKIGNSFYIRIPKDLIDLLGWGEGERIVIETGVDGKSRGEIRHLLIIRRFGAGRLGKSGR